VGFSSDKGGNTIDVHWYRRKTELHHVSFRFRHMSPVILIHEAFYSNSDKCWMFYISTIVASSGLGREYHRDSRRGLLWSGHSRIRRPANQEHNGANCKHFWMKFPVWSEYGLPISLIRWMCFDTVTDRHWLINCRESGQGKCRGGRSAARTRRHALTCMFYILIFTDKSKKYKSQYLLDLDRIQEYLLYD
jgi:hypothetical protein